MFYDFALTVPRNTPESAPYILSAKLTRGIIHRVEIEFPRNCAGLVYVRILHLEHQLYPTNPGGAFRSDGYVVPIDDYYPLLTQPYGLKLIGWNLDDTWAHTPTVRIGVMSERVAAKIYGNVNALSTEELLALFGLPEGE
jgi:hypothetical protein